MQKWPRGAYTDLPFSTSGRPPRPASLPCLWKPLLSVFPHEITGSEGLESALTQARLSVWVTESAQNEIQFSLLMGHDPGPLFGCSAHFALIPKASKPVAFCLHELCSLGSALQQKASQISSHSKLPLKFCLLLVTHAFKYFTYCILSRFYNCSLRVG